MVKIQNIKFSEIPVSLPFGKYTAVYTETNENAPDAIDKFPFLSMNFKVISNDINPKYNGRIISKVFSYNPDALFALRNFLHKVCGISLDLLNKDGFIFDTDLLNGRVFVIEIKENPKSADYPIVNILEMLPKQEQKKL
jgi:hypothetical protein